jgi:hypothetical protein
MRSVLYSIGFLLSSRVGGRRARPPVREHELRPSDLRVNAAAESAIAQGDHALSEGEVHATEDTLGHQFGVLDRIGGMADEARSSSFSSGNFTTCQTFHWC